jgi:hypothetical protein
MRQVVRHRPDTGEQWKRCVFAYVNAHSMALDEGGGWRRRIAGIDVEQGRDEFRTVRLKTCGFDQFGLKGHVGIAEQPRLTLQLADKRRQVAVIERALDLRHDKHLPRSERRDLRKVGSLGSIEALDERQAVRRAVNVLAELGIERDGSFQQQ